MALFGTEPDAPWWMFFVVLGLCVGLPLSILVTASVLDSPTVAWLVGVSYMFALATVARRLARRSADSG